MYVKLAPAEVMAAEEFGDKGLKVIANKVPMKEG